MSAYNQSAWDLVICVKESQQCMYVRIEICEYTHGMCAEPLCMKMCVCVCVCVYTCTCECLYMYARVTCVSAFCDMQICTSICACTCIPVCWYSIVHIILSKIMRRMCQNGFPYLLSERIILIRHANIVSMYTCTKMCMCVCAHMLESMDYDMFAYFDYRSSRSCV